MKFQFKTLVGKIGEVEDFDGIVENYLNQGWQLVGSPTVCGEFVMMPVIKVDQMAPEPPQITPEQFQKRYEEVVDQKYRDLLDLNEIILGVTEKGQYYTSIRSEKTIAGINPQQVVNELVKSKHCPVQLDSEELRTQLESLV